MIIKERKFDMELSYLLQLSIRAKLSYEDNEEIDTRIKGINGERSFDALVNQHLKHGLVLNNLQFNVNKQYFQIDALIIMKGQIFIFEIKNMYCDVCYKDNLFYFLNGTPIEKLNEQRIRTPKLFKILLTQNHIDLPFNYYTTFVNPDYKVYGYQVHENILEYHDIYKIITENSKITIAEYDEYIAKKLIDLQYTDEKFNFRKRINIEDLGMGVVCHCHVAKYKKVSNRKFKCPACKKEVNCNDYLQKAIEDIHLIYSMERLTVNLVKKWTESYISSEKIRTYLNTHHKIFKNGPLTFYR